MTTLIHDIELNGEAAAVWDVLADFGAAVQRGRAGVRPVSGRCRFVFTVDVLPDAFATYVDEMMGRGGGGDEGDAGGVGGRVGAGPHPAPLPLAREEEGAVQAGAILAA